MAGLPFTAIAFRLSYVISGLVKISDNNKNNNRFCYRLQVLEKIFSCLPFKDVRNAALVCHTWNAVLFGPKFQRCLRVQLQTDFCEELAEVHRKFVRNSKNLSIVQEFKVVTGTDEKDETEETNEPDTELSRVERNIASIIFSAKELNSLQLVSSYASLKNIIHNRLLELPLLKELRISFCYRNEDVHHTASQGAKDTIWQLESESLECFKLGQRCTNDHFGLLAPSLRELHMTVDCDELLDIVVMYCNQLEILRVKLVDIETLDKIMDLHYPLLKTLQLGIYDDKELQFHYSRTASRNENHEQAKRFIQRTPTLTVFSVQSNVAFYKIFPTLCSVKTQLQELSLHNIELDLNILLNVLLVQPLTKLSICYCEFTNQLPASQTRVDGLQHLHLVNVVNNALLDLDFSALKTLELFHNLKFESDSIQKVFLNCGAIEELVIHYRNTLDEDTFAKLPQLTHLKSLTVRSTDVTDLHWEACEPMLSVKRLTMSSCFMLRYSTFIELRRVFPSLQRLHVDGCHVLDDTNAAVDGSCEQKLRQLFSQCIVSWHDSVQITPLTLKQLLL
ncbi:uncharacterized protein LOC128735406 [Sabethes cyaneus]|uniref:uncharacterized protein LOC128735406 n=1 Tax=Sabethes cyaneus TaxID=53552 RepID=UPI00237ED936|nr:uncharacterized protein LOC128735406 [Sabethes cyaneus]